MDLLSAPSPVPSEPPWPPDLCLVSREASSIPAVHRTPPARVRTNTSPVRPVTSAQFDSEEELISAAQSILRKRIAAAEAELPPFSTAKDRRRVRQHQRQAMQKLCNNLDVSSSTSDIPTVFQREASPNGKSWPYHSVPDGQRGIRYSSSRSFAHFRRTGHMLAVGSMVPKVTSVRQFRLNSSLYVSGPMVRAWAPRSFFLCGTMPGREGNASRRRYMKLFSYK
ncbi:unnamed protein product [Brassica oleracea]